MLYSHIDIIMFSFPGNILQNIVIKLTSRVWDFDGTVPHLTQSLVLDSICGLVLTV